jgi:hypothetical protein
VVANPYVMRFNTLYYRRALVSVRAMVDPNNASDSLLTLLTDSAAHPGDLETTCFEMRAADSNSLTNISLEPASTGYVECLVRLQPEAAGDDFLLDLGGAAEDLRINGCDH